MLIKLLFFDYRDNEYLRGFTLRFERPRKHRNVPFRQHPSLPERQFHTSIRFPYSKERVVQIRKAVGNVGLQR